MPSVNAGAFNVNRDTVVLRPDGGCSISLRYNNLGGQQVVQRTIFIPNVQAQPIVDDRGGQVAAQVPAALFSAIQAFITQLDATISSGASGQKLDL